MDIYTDTIAVAASKGAILRPIQLQILNAVKSALEYSNERDFAFPEPVMINLGAVAGHSTLWRWMQEASEMKIPIIFSTDREVALSDKSANVYSLRKFADIVSDLELSNQQTTIKEWPFVIFDFQGAYSFNRNDNWHTQFSKTITNLKNCGVLSIIS